jgi:Glycosyltransferase family 87
MNPTQDTGVPTPELCPGSSVEPQAKSRLPAPYRRHTSIILGVLFLFAALKLYANLPPDLTGDGNFPPFYSSGVILKEGARRSLYAFEEQRAVETRLFPKQAARWKAFVYFYHPAYQAVFMLPFAYLPYRPALFLWMFLGIGAVLVSAWLLNPLFPEIRRLTGVPLGLIFLAFWPVVEALPYGQDSMFVLLFLALGFRLYCDRKDFASGAALSCALFKFQYIIPTVGMLFLRRRFKLLAGAVLVGILVVLACWAVTGTSGVVDYWNMLRHHPNETEWEMVDLRGFIDCLRGTYSPVLTLVASALVTLWAFLAKPGNRAQEFCAALLVSTLVSFHMHMYDMVVLLIPVMVVLERAARNRSWADAILAGIFFCAPFEPLTARLKLEYLWCLPILALFIAVTWPTRKPAEAPSMAIESATPTSA